MMYNEAALSVSTHLFSVLPSYTISVLLIDDQMIVAEAVRRMLADQPDIVFHYCSDPTKALDVADQVKPTVILQDLVMPNFDGQLLVKYFRANPATCDIPIIILSTKEDPTIKAETFTLGANDYIVKLPDKLELVARIRYHSKGYIRLLERNAAYYKLQENQQILNAELAEAASYVRSLLPKPLKNHIKTFWRFIPSTQLGGDAFGYHWLDDDHFAIYLLDVCGHGVGAALLSISVVNLLRSESLAKANFHDPSSVLKELNLDFQMEKHNNMFFTIWYGVYNSKTKQILYSSGGHPPAVLITGNNAENTELMELKTPGVVIGAIPEADFQNASCTIGPFNRLYIFSDGIYEINKTSGGMLELNEFIEILKQAAHLGSAGLDYIIQFAQNIQGKKIFMDDCSILEVIFNDFY